MTASLSGDHQGLVLGLGGTCPGDWEGTSYLSRDTFSSSSSSLTLTNGRASSGLSAEGTLGLAPGGVPGVLGPRGHHARRSPLGQPLEPLEGVVDEDPVLVPVTDLVGLVLAVVAVVHVVVVHAGDLEVDLLKVNKKIINKLKK